jgi:ribonuclease BN (tRNA processing enzyme)
MDGILQRSLITGHALGWPFMRLTVLGGCGAWPEAGQACSGFLVEHEGFKLLVDLGYATVPRLLELLPADQVDAVFITHRHPDHCADLNPLLRARVLRDAPAPALPLYALPGALDAVLALDHPGMLAEAYELREFSAGASLRIGPFSADTRMLEHPAPNAGVRLTAGHEALMYTGDSGPSPHIAELADGTGLLVAEASYVHRVPEESRQYLSSASQAGQEAARASARRLLLTHLMPGTDHGAARAAASAEYGGPVDVATASLVLSLD